MRGTAAALAAGVALLGAACTDSTGAEYDNVVISGTVTALPDYRPVRAATIRLTTYVFSVVPGRSGPKVYATATSDTAGRYVLRTRLDASDCTDSSLRVEASHASYFQVASMEADCSRRTIDIPLVLKVIAVRVEPAGGDVRAGSVAAYRATATMADGTESTVPGLWGVHWSLASGVSVPGECGRLSDPLANPVVFHAPDSPPSGSCSPEGGAVVSLLARIQNASVTEINRTVLIAVKQP